jgi:hypothetical protein
VTARADPAAAADALVAPLALTASGGCRTIVTGDMARPGAFALAAGSAMAKGL